MCKRSFQVGSRTKKEEDPLLWFVLCRKCSVVGCNGLGEFIFFQVRIALVGVFQTLSGLVGYIGYVHVSCQYSVDFVNIIDVIHLKGTIRVVSLDASDVWSPSLGFGKDGGMHLDQRGGSEGLECVKCG